MSSSFWYNENQIQVHLPFKEMALLEENIHNLQNPQLIIEEKQYLYCEEDVFEDDCSRIDLPTLVLEENDMYWEDEEILSLICKEKEGYCCLDDLLCDGSLMLIRKEAIDWIFKVKAHYGFTALTTVLAVNYFDRFITCFKFQSDKPWMGQLTAVTCLSLAAKIDETQVPLLVDLQVGDSKYVFEAKTIGRMELLVLSTLQWKMNPVTPISFFDHIIRRLGLRNHLHLEFIWNCESLLLSILADSRFVSYVPSMLASAIMMHVLEGIDSSNHAKYQNQLIQVLKINEDEVKDCYNLIIGVIGSHSSCDNKRKNLSEPGSPSGVFDANFSCDSSNDSWGLESTYSPVMEPRFKRRRADDQRMRLPSLNRMFC